MNKNGMTQIQKISSGTLIGILGFVLMGFGVASNQVWLTRGGIVAVTFASWMISWQ